MDEEGTHAQLTGRLRSLVDPNIAEHHARIVKNTGDGVLAEFNSVVEAVRCAVDVQRGMVQRNSEAHRRSASSSTSASMSATSLSIAVKFSVTA